MPVTPPNTPSGLSKDMLALRAGWPSLSEIPRKRKSESTDALTATSAAAWTGHVSSRANAAAAQQARRGAATLAATDRRPLARAGATVTGRAQEGGAGVDRAPGRHGHQFQCPGPPSGPLPPKCGPAAPGGGPEGASADQAPMSTGRRGRHVPAGRTVDTRRRCSVRLVGDHDHARVRGGKTAVGLVAVECADHGDVTLLGHIQQLSEQQIPRTPPAQIY